MFGFWRNKEFSNNADFHLNMWKKNLVKGSVMGYFLARNFLFPNGGFFFGTPVADCSGMLCLQKLVICFFSQESTIWGIHVEYTCFLIFWTHELYNDTSRRHMINSVPIPKWHRARCTWKKVMDTLDMSYFEKHVCVFLSQSIQDWLWSWTNHVLHGEFAMYLYLFSLRNKRYGSIKASVYIYNYIYIVYHRC